MLLQIFVVLIPGLLSRDAIRDVVDTCSDVGGVVDRRHRSPLVIAITGNNRTGLCSTTLSGNEVQECD